MQHKWVQSDNEKLGVIMKWLPGSREHFSSWQAHLFHSQELSQGAESTPGLSWSAQHSPFFCLNPLVASRTIYSSGSEYKMTTSAVSFLSTLFFFGRLKGVGRVQPHFALFKSCVLSLQDSLSDLDLPSKDTCKESEQCYWVAKNTVCTVTN